MNNAMNLRWSTEVKLITAIALTITLGVFVPLIWMNAGSQLYLAVILGVCLLFASVLIGYFISISPKGYEVDEEGIKLQLIGGTKVFKASEYEIDLQHDYRDEIKHSFRVFGSGGFFGFLGSFRVRNIGVSQFYLTDRKGSVIRLRNRKTGQYIYINKGEVA